MTQRWSALTLKGTPLFSLWSIRLYSVCHRVLRCRQRLHGRSGQLSISSGVESSRGCSRGIRTLPDRLAAEWHCISIANSQTIGFQTHDRVSCHNGDCRIGFPEPKNNFGRPEVYTTSHAGDKSDKPSIYCLEDCRLQAFLICTSDLCSFSGLCPVKQ